MNFSKTIDWKKVVSVSAYIAGEFLSVNDVYRLVTGKDPLTGEKASRLEAAAWLTLDVLTLGGSKAGKVAKVATKANKLVDVVKGSKVVSRVNKTVDVVKSSKAVSKANKVIDSGKAYLKSGVNKLLDTPLSLSPRLATAGGSAMNMGRTTLREAGQNVKKGFDNLVQAFAKNGDEVRKSYSNSRPKYGKGQVDEVFENVKKANNGKVIDPSGKEITWDKSKARNGQWDMGHIPGEKYSDMHQKYMEGQISKKEFLEWYRNPKNYRPELPSTNRSHRYE